MLGVLGIDGVLGMEGIDGGFIPPPTHAGHAGHRAYRRKHARACLRLLGGREVGRQASRGRRALQAVSRFTSEAPPLCLFSWVRVSASVGSRSFGRLGSRRFLQRCRFCGL